MKTEQKRVLLRQSIGDGKLIRAVGAYDAITARLVEDSGFEAVWASSLSICAALGLPDAGIVSMRELLDVARVLAASTKLPIIADCDSGFGPVNNVIHLVREYERAGIAAVCIEDQSVPKLNSLYWGEHQLASRDGFSEKIRVAVAARQDDNFLIIARIEALVAGRSVEEALDRADAYSAAGADVIAIHSRSESEQEVIRFIKRWGNRKPVMVIPTTYRLSAEQVRRSNIAVVVFANQLLRTVITSVKASLSVLARCLENGEITLEGMADLTEVFRLQRLENWKGFVKGPEEVRRTVEQTYEGNPIG